MGKSTINVIFNSYVSLPEGIYLHVILLYYVSFISSNVNPGLANPGWLIVVVPPNFVISMATEMVPPQQPRLLGVDSSGFDKKYPSLDFQRLTQFHGLRKTSQDSRISPRRCRVHFAPLSEPVATWGFVGALVRSPLSDPWDPKLSITWIWYIIQDPI